MASAAASAIGRTEDFLGISGVLLRRFLIAGQKLPAESLAISPGNGNTQSRQAANAVITDPPKDWRQEWNEDVAKKWLGFLNTYRTMCVAPEPEFRRLIQDIQTLDFAA